MQTNTLGQPIGAVIPNWAPARRPSREPIEGRFCRVEPLDAVRHGVALHEADLLDRDGRSWTYLSYGPFRTLESYRQWLDASASGEDPLFFAIIDGRSGGAVGVASYLRIDPPNGCIEIGHLHFSPLLQRTPAATEALFLLMDRAFALGYRRLEWKCNALNEPSCRAARRLGLSFEGIFRQATIVKGRNRDTAWFAAIDGEWPDLRRAFVQWLDAANFDAEGQQRVALSALTAGISRPARRSLTDP